MLKLNNNLNHKLVDVGKIATGDTNRDKTFPVTVKREFSKAGNFQVLGKAEAPQGLKPWSAWSTSMADHHDWERMTERLPS